MQKRPSKRSRTEWAEWKTSSGPSCIEAAFGVQNVIPDDVDLFMEESDEGEEDPNFVKTSREDFLYNKVYFLADRKSVV